MCHKHWNQNKNLIAILVEQNRESAIPVQTTSENPAFTSLEQVVKYLNNLGLFDEELDVDTEFPEHFVHCVLSVGGSYMLNCLMDNGMEITEDDILAYTNEFMYEKYEENSPFSFR